jgi:hypothetical protein
MGRRQKKLKGRRQPEEHLDEDESTVPNDEKWRSMTTYGLFASMFSFVFVLDFGLMGLLCSQ